MKNLVATFVSTFSLVSSASAYTNTVNKNMTGFYSGLHGGYEFTKSKIKSNLRSSTGGVDDMTGTHNSSINLKGMLGGLHFGYQYDFGRYLAGLEFSATFNKVHKNKAVTNKYDNNANLSTMDVKIKHQYSYGSALRLGYKIMPQWVAGIKLGYARNRYDIQYVDFPPALIYRPQHVKKKINYNNFVHGVYVEKSINDQITIGAEYNYTLNKRKKLINTSHIIVPAGAFNGMNPALTSAAKFSFKPHAHDFKIRLGYKF